MNLHDSAKVLLFLKNCYVNAAISESMPATWSEVFSDVSGDEVMAAAMVYARSGSKFFPSTGELFEILEVDDPISCLTEGQVWARIRRQIGNVGTNGKPELSDLEREVVSNLGGWRVMCQAEEADNLRRLPRVLASAKVTVRKKQRLNKLNGGSDPVIGAGDADA